MGALLILVPFPLPITLRWNHCCCIKIFRPQRVDMCLHAHYSPMMYNSLWDKSRSVQNVLHLIRLYRWLIWRSGSIIRQIYICGYSRMRIYPHHSAFQASAWPSLFLTLEKPRWFIWRSESIILPPLFYLLAAEKEQLRTFGRWCTAKFCRNNSIHPLVVWINIVRV